MEEGGREGVHRAGLWAEGCSGDSPLSDKEAVTGPSDSAEESASTATLADSSGESCRGAGAATGGIAPTACWGGLGGIAPPGIGGGGIVLRRAHPPAASPRSAPRRPGEAAGRAARGGRPGEAAARAARGGRPGEAAACAARGALPGGAAPGDEQAAIRPRRQIRSVILRLSLTHTRLRVVVVWRCDTTAHTVHCAFLHVGERGRCGSCGGGFCWGAL